MLLTLPLSMARQLRSTGTPPKAYRPADLLRDYNATHLAYLKASDKKLTKKGCDPSKQPAWAKAKDANKRFSANSFNTGGWSGFCQAGLDVCPDARANGNYLYYARAMGHPERMKSKKHDHEMAYCHLNGFLDAKWNTIVQDFTALQTAAKEECHKKSMDWLLQYPKITDALLETVGDEKAKKLLEEEKRQEEKSSKNGIFKLLEMGVNHFGPKLGPFFSLSDILNGIGDANRLRELSAPVVMDAFVASRLAAWNCAMGDLACDIAYCNYAYCLKTDGQGAGRALDEECEYLWAPDLGAMSTVERVTTSTTTTTTTVTVTTTTSTTTTITTTTTTTVPSTSK
jgi:hypothetical protein